MIKEAVWHDDGHQIHLELNKSEVVITSVSCPHTGECRHMEVPCLVEYFLDMYGLECNVGQAPVAADMRIAWSMIGNPFNLEVCQMWIIPTDDYVFASWVESERSTSSEASEA